MVIPALFTEAKNTSRTEKGNKEVNLGQGR
jgi:hypothetical protein